MGSQNRPLVRGELRCGWCGGTGKDKNVAGRCQVCGGSGTVLKHPDSRKCGACGGTGEELHLAGTQGGIHKRCGGSGWLEPR